MRISYPFAAIPNQVIRGGHGATNIAVLAVLLSHGRTFASLETMAKEIGCKRETVQKSIRYWQENGEKEGIEIRISRRDGQTSVIEIVIHSMHTTEPQKGLGGSPKRGWVPSPKRGYKEDHREEDTPKKNRVTVVDKSSRSDRPESVGEIIKRRRPSS